MSICGGREGDTCTHTHTDIHTSTHRPAAVRIGCRMYGRAKKRYLFASRAWCSQRTAKLAPRAERRRFPPGPASTPVTADDASLITGSARWIVGTGEKDLGFEKRGRGLGAARFHLFAFGLRGVLRVMPSVSLEYACSGLVWAGLACRSFGLLCCHYQSVGRMRRHVCEAHRVVFPPTSRLGS